MSDNNVSIVNSDDQVVEVESPYYFPPDGDDGYTLPADDNVEVEE